MKNFPLGLLETPAGLITAGVSVIGVRMSIRPTGFFEVLPLVEPALEDWQTNVELKKLFGTELAKGMKPFEGGVKVFPDDTNKALWISYHWLLDPVVIAAKDIYTDIVASKETQLDKDGLCLKLLKFTEEKVNNIPINDGKDRLTAFRLYAEIKGFVGKNTDPSINNFINKLEIVLVPSPKSNQLKDKVIEHEPIEMEVEPLPLDLKLVKAS